MALHRRATLLSFTAGICCSPEALITENYYRYSVTLKSYKSQLICWTLTCDLVLVWVSSNWVPLILSSRKVDLTKCLVSAASLWSVLDVLRRNNTLFPRVDLKYDPDASAATPILLHIHPHLDLLFSGYQQRLYKICLKRLRDLSPPVTLRYKDLVLSSNTATLRRSDVSRHFGPTYAGEGLQYPGVSFLFEDDNINETMKGGSTSKEDRQREVKRVIVCQTLPEHINPSHDVYEEIEENSSMTGSLQRAIIKV